VINAILQHYSSTPANIELFTEESELCDNVDGNDFKREN
jgi:hypothetical protein